MDFYDYMERYEGEWTNRGDFVTDMHLDDEFPRCHGMTLDEERKKIRSHLRTMHACQEAFDTFSECWKNYASYRKRHDSAGK